MRNLIIAILLILCLLPDNSFSQKPDYVGQWLQEKAQGKTPVQSNAFSRARSDFSRTKRYNLNANINQLNSILNTRPELVRILIPYGDSVYTLDMARVEIAAPEFTVKTAAGELRENTGVQYRGIVNNNPAHIASMNLTRTDKSIYFSTAYGNFVVNREGNDYIVYREQDMTPPVQLYCETPDAIVQMPIQQRSMAAETGCKVVKVYFECDYALYQSKGSTSAVSDYVMGFFNQVATLYANENITIQISQIYTWTTPDPYVSLTTPTAILNQFKANRGTNFNGNLAHFLTTRNIGGGVAYVDVICNKAFAYGVSRIYTTFSSVPTYSWTVNVVTHELGHNLGSPHTHSCSWSGGPIDNCYAVEGNCSPGPPPVNGGTIMSYCHLIAAGINFNNGFGPQPGNLIRAKVQNAACIATEGGTPPSSLSTSNITSTSATLNWASVPGATSYTAQYKLTSASTWTTTNSTSSTSITITGLSASSNYVWSVKAGCSSYSSNASFNTSGSSGSCSVPTSLAANSITNTGATLTWSAVNGATGYTIQYRTAASSTWTSRSATTNSLVLSGLISGTTYNWQVKANCSGYSTIASFTTTTSGECTTPNGLSTTSITQNSASLNWNAVSGATSYTIQYRRSSVTTWTTVTSTTNTKTISGLLAGTNYVWQVKTNCSSYSPAISFTTGTSSGCAAPTGLAASTITQNSAILNWWAVTGATSYTIQYRKSTTSTWTTVTSSLPSKLISGLLSGTNYIWQVKANCSVYSSQSSFTTSSGTSGCVPPTNLNTYNITSNSALLSWTAAPNASSYSIRYRIVGFSGWTYLSNVTGTSRQLTGLGSKRTYEWQISTKCTNGTTSSLTGSRAFTTL